MSKVIADISMSLDGYVTACGADQEHGLGIGGEAIHAWVLEQPRSPVDEAVLAHSFEKTGIDFDLADRRTRCVGQDPCGEPGRWIAVPKTAAISGQLEGSTHDGRKDPGRLGGGEPVG
jgi:hypothetical protein